MIIMKKDLSGPSDGYISRQKEPCLCPAPTGYVEKKWDELRIIK